MCKNYPTIQFGDISIVLLNDNKFCCFLLTILWDKNFVHPGGWLWIQWVVSVSKKFQDISFPLDQITNFAAIWNVEKIEKKVSFKES